MRICREGGVLNLTKARQEIANWRQERNWFTHISEREAEVIYRFVADKVAYETAEEVRLVRSWDLEEDDCFEDVPGTGQEDGQNARRRVRRGRHRSASVTVCDGVVAKLGKLPYSPAQLGVVQNVARTLLVEKRVRDKDIAVLLPKILQAYFTPAEEDFALAATIRSAAQAADRREVDFRA